ncbi:MAG TPA: sulfite exporter TauE/SafE family protein, partial [Lacipirellula sp.]
MDDVWLCLAAAAAGVVNAVAGGGTLLTFPAVYAALGSTAEAAVVANATSTVALFPGSLAGAWGYRAELVGAREWFRLLIVPSLVGGLIGSLLVTQLPENLFKQLVPWLILVAALLFLLQPMIARWTGIGRPHTPTPAVALGVIGFQFLVGVYGGYFGAGIGILMLSAL